jgi:flagellar basal body-associated protein FliL
MDPNKHLDGKDTFLDVHDPQDANAEAKMPQPKIRALWIYLTIIIVLALVAAALIAYVVTQ